MTDGFEVAPRASENRGRFQPGDPRAGRKRGVPNKATAEIKLAAQEYGIEALETLAKVMRNTKADPRARVAAANALLDRGYGKPAQTIQGDPENPLQHDVTGLDEFTRRIKEMASISC